jgi:hypothetical protein
MTGNKIPPWLENKVERLEVSIQTRKFEWIPTCEGIYASRCNRNTWIWSTYQNVGESSSLSLFEFYTNSLSALSVLHGRIVFRKNFPRFLLKSKHEKAGNGWSFMLEWVRPADLANRVFLFMQTGDLLSGCKRALRVFWHLSLQPHPNYPSFSILGDTDDWERLYRRRPGKPLSKLHITSTWKALACAF